MSIFGLLFVLAIVAYVGLVAVVGVAVVAVWRLRPKVIEGEKVVVQSDKRE